MLVRLVSAGVGLVFSLVGLALALYSAFWLLTRWGEGGGLGEGFAILLLLLGLLILAPGILLLRFGLRRRRGA